MASQEYKARIMQAIDRLDDDKAEQILALAESLQKPPASTSPRRLGTFRGKVRVSPSFNEPLPEDVMKAFEGDQ